MYEYLNAGPGLKKMFIAEIGIIVCTVLAMVPLIGIFAGVGAIVFAIISMLGLNEAGRDIDGCKHAFVLTLVNIVVGIFKGVCSSMAIIYVLLEFAGTVISFLIVFLVCSSVSSVMSELGVTEVATDGERVWKISFGCYIVNFLISILAMVPGLSVIAGIAGVITAIISVIAGILYMIFLNKSYQAFGA